MDYYLRYSMKYNQLNTLQFIEKARAIHGDRYDYSKVVYINNHTKVIIICPEHGEFLVTPARHLYGNKCKQCSRLTQNKNKVTQPVILLTKFNQIHNNKYRYPNLNYKTCKDKIEIICPIHGKFYQVIAYHLSGNGCPKCGYDKIKFQNKCTFKEFLEKANLIHKHYYRYDEKFFINFNSKIKIYCPIHGDFYQRVNAHLRGQGCPKCGYLKTSDANKYTFEEFMEKAKIIHNNKYSYPDPNYVNMETKIGVMCDSHGIFYVAPANHLYRKSGCPSCNSSKGEIFISEILDKNTIQYIREYRIPNQKYRFEYDFYLPDYNLLIEFHGIQHYKAIPYFGGSDNFEYVKRNDLFKKELAKMTKYKLIVISYLQLKKLNKTEFENMILRKIKNINI